MNPEVPDTLMDALQSASISEEHRTLMGTVVISTATAQAAEVADLNHKLELADEDITLINRRLDEAQDGATAVETLQAELARAKEQARTKLSDPKYALLNQLWSSPDAFLDLPKSVSDATQFFQAQEGRAAEKLFWTPSLALADFVAEWKDTNEEEHHEYKSLLPGDEAPVGWTMHFDGALSTQGAGAGVVLVYPANDKLHYAVQLRFQHGEKVSNNTAEYEGLIAGLKAASALGIKRLTIKE
nr:uncharacterized protein LOC109746197 [Aegilops tauschii subsp. strangulata]